MSQWLQEEMSKIEDERKQKVPLSRRIITIVLLFAAVEAALFLLDQFMVDFNIIWLCVFIGFIGIVVAAANFFQSKSLLQKPKLTFAAQCLEKLDFSPEELAQFDEEMLSEPLVFIQNGRRFDSSIAITEHYMRAAFLYRKEIDYGVFRLSDIAMTCNVTSKNPVILKPAGRIFDVVLFDNNGERVGGVSMEKEQDFAEFNAALEKYAPNIRQGVSMEEAAAAHKK